MYRDTSSDGELRRRGDTCAQISEQFLSAMAAAGVHMDTTGGHPKADGKLHRASATGKKKKKNDHIWYVLHLDEPASGAFGDLQLGVEDTWTAKRPNAMTKEERSALKRRMEEAAAEREREKKALNEAAAAAAAEIKAKCEKADPEHPYLARKGIPATGAWLLTETVRYRIVPGERMRTAKAGNLFIPMWHSPAEPDAKPTLVGGQFIYEDGTKRYIKGTPKENSYHTIGGKPKGERPLIIIAEGFATGARIHQATGTTVIIAFDSGNLMPVAKLMAAKYPGARFLIAADNDRFTTKPIENPGLTKAREAAEAIGAKVAYPVFPPEHEEATDFDDLARIAGLDAVKETLRAALKPPVQDEAPPPRSQTVQAIANPADALRPTIRITKSNIHEVVRESIRVLGRPRLEIFRRGQRLVMVVPASSKRQTIQAKLEPSADAKAHPEGVVITDVEAETLVEKLTSEADFVKYDGRSKDWISINCPEVIARTVLKRKGDGWERIPPLHAVITAPCMRDDGSIIMKRGYDSKTGLYLASKEDWPDIPERPSRDDAVEALNVLSEPIAELPFVDNSDRAAALALFLTALMRPMLRSAPMFAVTAPTAGTGKSLLINIASIIARGHSTSPINQPSDEAELEKRIGAEILAGNQLVSIDNVSHTLQSDQLCQILTEEHVQVRILGKSENVRVPSTALICVNGNNLSISGDLNRRTVRIRMNAKVERPEKRAFQFDAKQLALQKRPKLVAAALTILKAYLVAEFPDRARPLGSFEDWSDVVRSALLWVQMEDCLAGYDEQADEDPEKEVLREVLNALPTLPFTAKEIAGRVVSNERLREALHLFLDRNGTFNTRRFGRFLKQYRDRPVDGRALHMVTKNSVHGHQWCVKEV
ncbi:toprim domain-containing protein [Nitratireductor sp. CH_MIT9313-5]|uniref:toprim domain-containing protein n=1 Tax=Nitratireductor sp. CH_MIT9313-5 TaxID=3107764 RepID=UPI00300A4A77